MSNSTKTQAILEFTTQLKTEGAEQAASSCNKVSSALGQIATSSRPAQTWLDKLGQTVANTFRYQVVNKFTDALFNGLQDISSYLKEVDKELNTIQIVSGQTQQQVQSFLSTAEQSAKVLGNTTTDYLEAAKEYYQQGLSTNEVLERTNATIKAANISGQDISDTVEQITAVLNGFNISANDVNDVLSVMTSLGASTASDFEELSTASQKVASAASTAGIPLNNLMSMITTIASVTRESAESVGTSLNAMIGRFNKLSVDEKQKVSSTIETTLKNTQSGVSMFDEATGQVRDLNSVLTDLASVWQDIDKNSQEAILTQLAGTRQANRLAALMNNWDDYETNLKTAQVAEGSLDAQNKVYMQSLEALDNQMKTASDTMWGELFNSDMLKAWDKGWISFYTTLGNVFKNIGGIQPVISQLVVTLSPLISKLGTPVLLNTINSLTSGKLSIKGDTVEQATNELRSIDSKNVGGKDTSNLKALSRNDLGKMSESQVEEYKKALEVLNQIKLKQDELNVAKTDQAKLDKAAYEDAKKQLEETTKEAEAIEKAGKNASKRDAQKAGGLVKKQNNFELAASNLEGSGAVSFKNTNNGLSRSGKAKTGELDKSFSKNLEKLLGADSTSNEVKELIEKYKKALKELTDDINDLGGSFQVGNSKELTELIDSTKEKSKENVYDVDNVNNLQYDLTNLFNSNSKATGFNQSINKNASLTKLFSTLKLPSADENSTNLMSLLEEDADKLIGRLQEAGVSMKDFSDTCNKAAETGIKDVDAKVDQANESLKETQTFGQRAVETIKNSVGSTDFMKVAQKATALLSTLPAVSSAFDTLTSSTTTGTQKMQAGIQGVGTVLSAVTSDIPVIGSLVSAATTALTFLAEKFQWGADAAEQAANVVNNNLAIMDAQTQKLDEEQNALSQVTSAADTLGKKYKEQKFTYAELTEEEKTNYDQVAEYCNTYAPDLINYYDAEGKAVLDLTKLYGSYGDTKRNALDTQYLEDAYDVYSNESLQSSTGVSGAALLTTYSVAKDKLVADKQELANLQAQEIQGATDLSDKIQEFTDDITAQQEVIQNLSSNWDELISKPITYGNEAYQNLSDSGQSLVSNLASYSNFSNVGIDEGATSSEEGVNNFTTALQTFTEALNSAGDSAQNFLGMDEQLQISAANMGISFGLTNEQFQTYIGSLNQASFLQGDFIDGLVEMAETNADETIKNLTKSLDKLKDSKDEAVNTVDTTYSSENRGTGGANGSIGGVTSADYQKEKINETIVEENKLTDAIEKAEKDKQKAISRTFSLYGKELRKYAQTSNSAYNEVLDSYYDLQDQMVNADADTKASLQKRSNIAYAVLKGDDEDYYNQWVAANQSQTLEASNQYGIRAENYKTYNEYMTALDNQQAKYRLIIEKTAGQGISKIARQLTTEKYNNLAVQLKAAGDTASAMVMIEATETDDKALLQNASTLNELLNLRTEVEKTGEASQDKYDDNVKMYDGIAEAYNTATQDLDGATKLTRVGGKNFGKETALMLIDDAIAALQKNAGNAAEAAGIDYDELKKNLDDYSNAMSDLTDTPDFNYDLGAVGDLSYKDVGSETPSYTTPASGSGSSGSSDSTKKTSLTSLDSLNEGEVYDEEIDKLKEYDDQITQIEHDIDLLSNAREHLYGSEYLKNLDAEIKKQEENLSLSKQRLEATKKIAAEEKTNLDTQAKEHSLSLDYSATGQISNYNEIIEAMENASKEYQTDIDKRTSTIKTLTAEYDILKQAYDDASDADESTDNLNVRADQLNALATQINALTAAANDVVTNQSTYNDWASTFKDSMDEYEKYAVEEVQSTESDIQEKISSILADKIDAIEYPVTIIVEAASQNEKYLDLLSSIAKNKGKVTFSVDTTTNLKKLENTVKEINALLQPDASGGLKELISQTEQLLSAASETDLASAPQDLLTSLRDQEETLIDTASSLQEIISTMSTAFSEGIDSAVEALSDAYDKMDNVTTAYSNLVNAAQKTQMDTFDLLTNASAISLETSQKQIAQLKEQAAAIKDTRDKFAEGTDEYLTADNAYIQQLNKIASLQQSAAESLEKTISNLTDRNNTDIETAILGTSASTLKQTLSDLNDSRKKYLAQERSIYQISKLEADIQTDIDKKQDNSVAQQRLKAFQKSELEYLQNKSNITQTDLDLSQKQYNLLKAQIELEEAKEGKDYVRMLQRNSSGNYAYMSVADTSKIDSAKEAYQKAIDELYQYASTQYDSYLNDLSTATTTYETKLQNIISQYQSGQITKEKAEELYAQAQEALKAQYAEDQEYLNIFANQMAGSTELQKQAADNLDNLLSQNKTLDTLINGNAEGFEDMYKSLTGKDVGDTVLTDLNNGVQDLSKNWEEFFDIINTDISTVDFSKLNDNVNTILDSIDNYNELLKDWALTAANTADSIISTDLINQINQNAADINDQATEQLAILTSTVQAYQSQREAMEASNLALLEMIDSIDKATEKIETTFGVTNGTLDTTALTDTISTASFGDSLSMDTTAQSAAAMLAEAAKAAGASVTSSDQYHIEMEFPNVTEQSEIVEAFENLNNYVDQYLANNKN